MRPCFGRECEVTRVRDLTTKRLVELSDDDVAYCHLSYRDVEVCADHLVRSNLHYLEIEMTQSRGLRVTASYSPLLLAFAILDQIGSCYRDLSRAPHPSGGSAIARALYYFCDRPALSDEVKALYALRNGLVHDGSLTCQTNAGQWHFFRYDFQQTAAVRLPTQAWDGTATGLSGQRVTRVNPRVLTDEVSRGISALRNCYFLDRNNLDIQQPSTDILHKYLFWERRAE